MWVRRRAGWLCGGRYFFHKEDFLALNREQEAQGLPAYVNARNTASGSLKQKDSRETAKRKLTAYIYAIVDSEGVELGSEWETLQYLRDMVIQGDQRCSLLPGPWMMRGGGWAPGRRDGTTLPFEIDGLVLKVDSLSQARELGVVGKDPRGGDRL